MFANLENNRMFAVSSPKTIKTLFVSAFFYANTVSAFAGNIQGYQIPTICCTEKFAKVFGETGGDSLSYILNSNNFYSFMPKTIKIENVMNNSNYINTPNSATTISIEINQEFSELKKRIAVEKNCKSEAYAFILAMGLLEEFKTFTEATKDIEDKHALALSFINF